MSKFGPFYDLPKVFWTRLGSLTLNSSMLFSVDANNQNPAAKLDSKWRNNGSDSD